MPGMHIRIIQSGLSTRLMNHYAWCTVHTEQETENS